MKARRLGARGRGDLGPRDRERGGARDREPRALPSDPSAQFDNLKPIKAPNPCKNDPGITDTDDQDRHHRPDLGSVRRRPTRPSLDGIKARVAKANADGELGDRKITLVNVDDAGDAARNVTAAQQLVE